MCGIAGLFNARRDRDAQTLRATVTAMTDAIRHRGPDAGNAWIDAASGIALGHRRLSIIDLSPTGAQPMNSPAGRFCTVFNGEIYNYLELRSEIESAVPGIRWRGTSDTEVALAVFEQRGVAQGLERVGGMFALALWDRPTHTLYLARDRMGEKPLYYGWAGDDFVFASELKAFRAHPRFAPSVDRDLLCSFLRNGYVPGPRSIYVGVHKLPPGTFLALSERDLASGNLPTPQPYWQLATAAAQPPWTHDDTESVDALEALLKDAVKKQMVADVPLGAFLSGGVDSSTVVALMQAQSAQPVKTFTIGFDESEYNEAEHAKAVATHLGTDHHELYVTPPEARKVIPLLPAMYDEPFADASQIPTYLVSKLARGTVTVSLSGDGGDELFCGYNRYLWGEAAFGKQQWLPAFARRAMGAACRTVPMGFANAAFATLRPALPKGLRFNNVGDKLHKLGDVLAAETAHGAYKQLVSQWSRPSEVVLDGREPLSPDANGGPEQFVPWMMYNDTLTYLPDDILVKTDRAAMAVSLESRVPLLDHRIVEFAWRQPMHMKLRGRTTKWMLREVLYRHVPKTLIERPKMGFGVPIGEWLRRPLRDWAEALLDRKRLEREGYLNAAPIEAAWKQHLSGRGNFQYHLWTILMFQAWLEHSFARTP